MMIGTELSALNARQTSMPESFGSIQSSRTTSYSWSRAAARPASPSPAMSTAKPSLSSAREIAYCIAASSSTIRIRAGTATPELELNLSRCSGKSTPTAIGARLRRAPEAARVRLPSARRRATGPGFLAPLGRGNGHRSTSRDHAGVHGVQAAELRDGQVEAEHARPRRAAQVLPLVRPAHGAPGDALVARSSRQERRAARKGEEPAEPRAAGRAPA